ncbi:elongation factor G [Metallumcola ferriviriculae]|uniref:Elongation factor G n=1 Tax=Metallumcola ferriviriculae TaxID=3039180 RepID=A0AAU0UPZ2_9FIRM|nr:elongation factor G [Desulfitibacteraceae bacterium MK1]
MQVFQSDKIRNVGVVSHGGAGKTSLVEAMLYNTGVLSRLGKVDEGNTTTDYLPEEINRKVTINTALAPCVWKNVKVNLLDTPGYSDFIGEVKGAMRVVDSLLFTLCAVSGVEVQTEIIWEYAQGKQKPKIAFINKIDRENANFYRVVNNMKEILEGSSIVPIQLPIGEQDSFKGVVNLLEMQAYVYADGKASKGDIPPELTDNAKIYREALIEAAAEADDELLMKYLDGEELTEDEIKKGLKAGIKSGKVTPVLCGSAINNMGVDMLLDFLSSHAPSPLDVMEGDNLHEKPLAAQAFKTIADPYVGRLTLFRVFSGVFKADTSVYNANKEEDEKISQVFVMQGKTQHSVPEINPGDIGAVTKLQYTTTGDTLTIKQDPQLLEGLDFPVAHLTVAISPKSKGDEEKVGSALAKIMEEDPSIKLEKNIETKQTLLTGMGELHLDIIVERLQNRFNVEVESFPPRIPYRETIRKAVQKVEGKHKKQSGGHGQYGHVYVDMVPADEDFIFEQTIFGGSVPKQYFPAVEKGIQEAMVEGSIAGYPVTNLKVVLVDGSYHAVDSSEMAFKIAGALAFRKAMQQASPILLEPVMNLEVTVPSSYMGDIMGDLNGKRGKIMGMEPKGKYQVIKAQAPLGELHRYPIDLKSITQGRGTFHMEFDHYEQVPENIAQKIIEESKAEGE